MLKSADPKFRKAIISNCNKELFNCISDCFLNVLNGNIKLTGCVTRKLQKHKAALRKVSDRRVPLSKKKKLKKKMKFAKGVEQAFSTEIFHITKVIERRSRPVYELEDLNKTPIEGKFYAEELTPVRMTEETTYK